MIKVSSNAEMPNLGVPVAAHAYLLGGQTVVFQSVVQTLAAFSNGPVAIDQIEFSQASNTVQILDSSNAELQYTGTAPFAGKQQEISCWVSAECWQINIEGKPSCHINLPNKHIHLLNEYGFDERLNVEIVTGPALMLILAQGGVFTLHAGAVACSNGAMAFIAESGVGKSTLSEDAGYGWPQYADDMVPLTLSLPEDRHGAEEFYLQDYPQLKLFNAIAPHRLCGSIPLKLVVRLSPKNVGEMQIRSLAKSEAMLQIIRHSVAAKLFDKPLMNEHVKFAQRLSMQVPLIEVSYPRDLSQLQDLRATLMSYVESL